MAESGRMPAARFPPRGYNSTGTSILQNGMSRRGASSHGSLAAMTYGSSSRGSGPSISSSLGARNVDQRLFQDGVNLPTQSETIYECPFDRLDCRLTFSSFKAWHTHSLTHFDGIEPPTTNSCCFCEAKFKAKDGYDSWRQRMDHVELHHRNRHRLRSSRCDMELYRHLWKHRRLSDIDFKELTGESSKTAAEQAYPSPANSPTSASSSSAFTVTEERRRNRRGGG